MNCFLRPVRRSSCDSLDRSSPVTSAVGSYCVSVKTKPSETIVPEVPFAGDGVSTWRTCASTMVCLETGEHLSASFAGVEEGESFPLVTAMDCDCVVVASAPATAGAVPVGAPSGDVDGSACVDPEASPRFTSFCALNLSSCSAFTVQPLR